MEYILLLMLNLDYSAYKETSVTKLEFSTYQACERAGKKVQEITDRAGSYLEYVCLKK